jgi:predicted DNA-binding transcriptional regulator AlpA
MKRLLSFDEGCAKLGYHPQHARKLIKAGKLKAPIRLYKGGRPLFVEQDIEEIIAEALAARDSKSAEAK